jgi:hypothetical protein
MHSRPYFNKSSVLDFQSIRFGNGYNLRAAIYIITQKEIVGFGGEATVLEKTKKIRVLACSCATVKNCPFYSTSEKLTVDIANDLQGGLELKKNWLRHKNFTCLKKPYFNHQSNVPRKRNNPNLVDEQVDFILFQINLRKRHNQQN